MNVPLKGQLIYSGLLNTVLGFAVVALNRLRHTMEDALLNHRSQDCLFVNSNVDFYFMDSQTWKWE